MARGSGIIRVLLLVFWIALTVGALSLLMAAMETRNAKPCNGYHIYISGVKDYYFVNQQDVLDVLHRVNGQIKGKPLKEFDLKKMEDSLERNPWIGNAELYFDNNRILQVKVEEKEPVARIFTTTYNSFYIDTALSRLPLNDRITPRLPVFTGFPSDKKSWRGKDSVLMKEIRDLSLFFRQDSFWNAQIDQVNINADRGFDMVPKVGDHTLVFGHGDDIESKFHRLYLFYEQVLRKTGWDRYSAVNVAFQRQVVATRKDVQAFRADTSLARQWIRQMIKNNRQQVLSDSANTHRPVPDRVTETDNRNFDMVGSADSSVSDPGSRKAKPRAQNPKLTKGNTAAGKKDTVKTVTTSRIKAQL